MKFNLKQKDSVLYIDVEGEFDTILARELQTELEAYIDKGIKNIDFDLAKVTHIASSGLRVMIFARERMGDKINVSVLNPKGIVLDVLKMSGIDNFIKVVK